MATMKSRALRFSKGLLLALACTLAVAAAAQPTWRFHLAFEDGTGARDTLWFIWDTTATVGWTSDSQVDYELGEGRVEMAPDIFNVWMYNWDLDSTKTLAYPYTWFPLHGEQEIRAFSFEFPITIRWDRSLFHADYLPDPDAIHMAAFTGSTYFFWNGNYPELGGHSLLEADSVVVGEEALWTPLFPMLLYIAGTDNTGLLEDTSRPLRISQDKHHLYVSMPQAIRQLSVLDASGHLVYSGNPGGTSYEVPIGTWSRGLYIVRAYTTTNTWHHGKFIKMAP